MSVERYEKIWMWGAGMLIVMFLGAISLTAGLDAVHPPSHLETVDPATLDAHPEFGKPSVAVRADGTVVVTVVASMFSFAPDPIEVPNAHSVIAVLLVSADTATHRRSMALSCYVREDAFIRPPASPYPELA